MRFRVSQLAQVYGYWGGTMHPSRRLLPLLGTLLCLAALMAACGAEPPAPGATSNPTRMEESESRAEPAAPTAQPTSSEFTSPLEHRVSPLPAPSDGRETEPDEQPAGPIEIVPPGSDPLTGEVPQDLLDAVLDDLADQLDAGREAIAVEQAGAVVWRDGSLGCPQPDMMYTQALVPGYRIVLRVSEETFDYHASERGYFVLCEGGLAQEPLPPGDGGGPLVDQ